MDRIKNWFRSLGSKAQSFMYGRYGYDELSQFLSKTALICIIIGLFIYPGFFCSLAMALYLISMFRMYSKNTAKRQQERNFYLSYQQLYRQYRQAEQTYETNAQGFDMGAMQIQKVCMGLCLAQMFCNPFGCLRCI